MPVIPALGRLRQEEGAFKGSLGYTVKPYLKNQKRNKVKERKETL
jgi:hypothetical protein